MNTPNVQANTPAEQLNASSETPSLDGDLYATLHFAGQERRIELWEAYDALLYYQGQLGVREGEELHLATHLELWDHVANWMHKAYRLNERPSRRMASVFFSEVMKALEAAKKA